MKAPAALLGIVGLAGVVVILVFVQMHKTSRQSTLASAQAVASDCGLGLDRVRLLPRERYRPDIGITGLYLDPVTGERNRSVICFQARMAELGIAFEDHTIHAPFLAPIP